MHDWFKRMAEKTKLGLSEAGEVAGILVGGPGYTKQQRIDGGHLRYELRSKVLKPLVDAGDTSESGLREVLAMGGHIV